VKRRSDDDIELWQRYEHLRQQTDQRLTKWRAKLTLDVNPQTRLIVEQYIQHLEAFYQQLEAFCNTISPNDDNEHDNV
jgi:hypothetical protein